MNQGVDACQQPHLGERSEQLDTGSEDTRVPLLRFSSERRGALAHHGFMTRTKVGFLSSLRSTLEYFLIILLFP
jgi:hypothetical protein